MRPTTTPDAMPPELQLAIGLAWGHLHAYQYDDAHELALGCLQLWPDNTALQLLCDHAAVELMLPVDLGRLRALRHAGNADWVALLLRRARQQTDRLINPTPRRT